MAISKQESFNLYKTMFLVREAEFAIQRSYGENEMKTPMHMSMGEEAIVAGVVSALNKDDQVLGTYRSHALYLAKTGDIDGFFAEMYGKETGNAKGKAGSMHLSYPEKGLMGTSAIVATTISVAVGCALANVYMGNKRRVAVFFGDGAIDEGSFWESLNFACLKKLPIIFVFEDNDLAIHSFKKERRGYKSLSDIISNYDCYIGKTDTTDCEEIYDAVKFFKSEQDEEMKPVFIELSYYRYLEHVGIEEDFKFGYRDREEYERWLEKDPLGVQLKRLSDLGIASEEIMSTEKRITAKVLIAQMLAKQAPFAKKEELFTNVYA